MSSPDVVESPLEGPRRSFLPAGLATGIGSLPHVDPARAVQVVLDRLPRFPFWPQLPRRSPLEGMTLQYLEGFPALREQGRGKEPLVDTGPDGLGEVEAFYDRVLSGDLEPFGFSGERASGFYTFEETLVQRRREGLDFVKGHVTGPVTLASALRDLTGREITYDETFREVVAAFVARKALWQTRRLGRLGAPVVMFLDEPVMEVYGSAYSALTAETVLDLWRPGLDALREAGALSGIHCCGNTDWELLFESGVDIVNFDAYHYLERMLLYPGPVERHLRSGGVLAWGIVPTSPEAEGLDATALRSRWEEAVKRFRDAGVDEELLRERCVLTPSCGMGSLSPELAEKILALLAEVSDFIRDPR